MPLPDGFPLKINLEQEGYESVEDVQEATDDELLAIQGIAEVSLAKIRDVAPYKPSAAETGTGETSGGTMADDKADNGEETKPARETYESSTSGLSKDQTDPSTGQDLPEGVVKSERGTLTANAGVEAEEEPKEE